VPGRSFPLIHHFPFPISSIEMPHSARASSATSPQPAPQGNKPPVGPVRECLPPRKKSRRTTGRHMSTAHRPTLSTSSHAGQRSGPLCLRCTQMVRSSVQAARERETDAKQARSSALPIWRAMRRRYGDSRLISNLVWIPVLRGLEGSKLPETNSLSS